jgi:hypothetical protein
VSEGRDAPQVELTHLASGLRTWCARRLATLPEGTSAHVITAYGTPVRVDVEKTRCPGEHGRLSIFPREPPATFATAVTVCLNDQLETLLAASTDRRVLLFENSCRLWSVGQLRTELEASLEFPGLSRIDETWMVDVTASVFNEGPTFRRVTP